MPPIRKTAQRSELDPLHAAVAAAHLAVHGAARTSGVIGNGGTAGNLRTTASCDYTVDGPLYVKAATDDLWDLSGETDTAAAEYRAYWLYLDASGTASFAAGDEAASAALALAALPAKVAAKSVVGVYVAAPECDFDDAGGLAAQGTIHNGVPAGVPVGVPRHTSSADEAYALVSR